MKKKINMEGKVAICLKKDGFVIRKNVLVTVEAGVLSVFEIKKELHRKEVQLLSKNMKYGLQCIKKKLREGGPIEIKTITNGDIYYDDVAAIRSEKEEAYIVVFKQFL